MTEACLNTDREIFREPNENGESDYYCNSIRVTQSNEVSMIVGGTCITLPMSKWHELAMKYSTQHLPKTERPKDDGLATIYLTAQRKYWHHEVPSGWLETHWERGDYIECGIYTKPIDELTDEDRQLVEDYGQVPIEWNDPAPNEIPIPQ